MDHGAIFYFRLHLVYFFLAIEHLGERPLAVTNIVRNISALLIMVISAFATTAGALISNQIGAGEQRCLFKPAA